MRYLLLSTDGELEQCNEISDDTRQLVLDETLRVLRFEKGDFQELFVEFDEENEKWDDDDWGIA